jgi:hypothetical protein
MRRFVGSATCRWPLCVVVWYALTSTSSVMAQRYQVDSIAEKFQKSKTLKSAEKINADVARGTKKFASNRSTIEEYYNGYFFPAMTDPSKRGKLSDMRIRLTNELAFSTGEAHDFLLNVTYKKCRGYLSSKYDPAVRYNCTLLLGDLNQSEASLKEGIAPVPYKPAMQDLIKLFASSKLDDATRVACLIGLRRHAQLCGPKDAPNSFYQQPKVQNYLVGKLYKFARAANPPEGRADEAHQWMRQLTVETLGFLRIPGKGDAVAKLLMKVATQAESPIALRCAAVEALARLDLEGSGIKGEALADTAGQVVYAACKWETLEIMKEFKGNGEGGMQAGMPRRRARTITPGSQFGDGPNRPGQEPKRRSREFIPADPMTVPYRRRLIHELLTVRRALEGDKKFGINGIQNMPGAEADAKEIVMIIDGAIQDAEDGDLALYDLGTKINSARVKVQAFIPQDTPPIPVSRGT